MDSWLFHKRVIYKYISLGESKMIAVFSVHKNLHERIHRSGSDTGEGTQKSPWKNVIFLYTCIILQNINQRKIPLQSMPVWPFRSEDVKDWMSS
jgi:hypothetical protein